MTTIDHRLAARDALTGLALGDAFGAQFFVPDHAPLLPERRLAPPVWPWTDDTEMACSVFAALRDRGTVDQWELADLFARHHDFDRGYGPATNRMLRLLRERKGSWRQLAGDQFDGQGSFGNGAAMRVAPLGAWFAVDPAEAAWQAARSAETTHTHPEAVAGAVAVAVAAAWAVRARTEPLDPADLLTAVLALTPASRVREGITEARALLAQPDPGFAAHRLGNGRQVSAVDTVPFTLWCAAKYLTDYQEALWATASAGGDVDTTCAIVGGIVAAHVTAAALPADWLAATEPLPDWVRAGEPGHDLAPADFRQDLQPLQRPLPVAVPDLLLTPGQWQRARHGVQAHSMEEKWLAHLVDRRLHLHRSWTGHQMYEVAFTAEPGGHRVTAALYEGDPEYHRTTPERAAELLSDLLEGLFGHPEDS